mgnify:FL=1
MFKKVLAVGFSAVLALSLVACGGSKDNKSKSSKETTTASESEAATVYSVKDEKIKVDSGVIKLADYSQLTVYEDDVKVTDDSYKSQVDYILEQSATYKDTKSAKISSVDKVKVDYTGQIKYKGKKVTFEGGTASDQEIDLGNNSSGYIDGFTKALEGQHKVGDKFTKKLKFPDTYTNNTKIDGKEVKLAGKTVWFTFTIKSISTKSVPKLTDKFVKEKFGAYGVTDVKSFEKYAREQMRTSNIMNKVWSTFVASCEVVSYSSTEKESLKKVADANYESQLQSQYGVDLDSYLEAASMSKEDWDNNIMSQVESSLKTKMVYQALAKKADLVPSDSDYNKEAETLAQQNSLSVKELESTYGKTEVEYAVITQRVQKYIAENVTVKEGSEPTTAAETTEAATTAK